MTITVSMPYYRNPEWVEDAVRSVLAQTVEDIVLVVVGDGEDPPLSNIKDSRLIVYRIPENRGAYFAQQVVVQATPHAWYAPHAADDWSEPDHLERLAAFETDVASGAVWYHNGGYTKILRKLYEVGLYRTERLRSIGGYNPSERIGQDSLTLRMLRVTGPLEATTHPTYHRVQRAGSLCTDPATKRGSPARNEMKARNRMIAARCEQLGDADRIRKFRERRVPPKIRAEVAKHAARLAELMGA